MLYPTLLTTGGASPAPTKNRDTYRAVECLTCCIWGVLQYAPTAALAPFAAMLLPVNLTLLDYQPGHYRDLTPGRAGIRGWELGIREKRKAKGKRDLTPGPGKAGIRDWGIGIRGK